MARSTTTVSLLWKGNGPMTYRFGGKVERDSNGNQVSATPAERIELVAPRNPARETPVWQDVDRVLWERAKADKVCSRCIAGHMESGHLVEKG